MTDVSPLDPSVAREYAAGNPPWSADTVRGSDEHRYYEGDPWRSHARALAKWRETPEGKHVKKTADVLVRSGAAAAALGIAGALAAWAWRLDLRYATASLASGIVIALICMTLGRYTMVAAARGVVPEDDEPRQAPKVTSKWLQDPDLQNLITLNRTQMQVYHELATKQATYAARNSRRAMLVGFMLLVTGGVVALQADDDTSKVVAGTLAGLGSLLAGYIGQTFLAAEDRAMKQLNFYFQQPLVTSYMLAAERLTLKLTEAKRDSVLSDVIKQILGAARTAEITTDGTKLSRTNGGRRTAPAGSRVEVPS